MRAIRFLPFAAAVLSLHGCDLDVPITSKERALPAQLQTQGVTRTDLELLRKFISLPITPRRVHWQTIPRRADDWWLAAVFEFSPSELERLLQNSKKMAGLVYVLPEHLAWFPADIRHKYADVPANSDGMIAMEGQRYEVDAFVSNSVSPLKQGYIGAFDQPGLAFLAMYTF